MAGGSVNEIAVRQSVDLEVWAQTAAQTHQIAVSLAKTSFVPKSMQGRPDEITGAILAGREMGLEPMAALRSIDIIDGTPAVRALTLRALVQAHGHQVWVAESTATRAVVHGRRRGEEHIEISVWTMDRARTAGLTSKKNWTAHPTAMLVARATAEVCRLVAADVLLGMPYTTEEISDGVIYNIETGEAEPVGDVTVQTPKMAAPRKMRRKGGWNDNPPEAPALDGPEPPREIEAAPDEPAVPGDVDDGEWPATAAPGGAAS